MWTSHDVIRVKDEVIKFKVDASFFIPNLIRVRCCEAKHTYFPGYGLNSDLWRTIFCSASAISVYSNAPCPTRAQRINLHNIIHIEILPPSSNRGVLFYEYVDAINNLIFIGNIDEFIQSLEYSTQITVKQLSPPFAHSMRGIKVLFCSDRENWFRNHN